MATDLHPTLITILVGNGSVGKSTLTARFTKGIFIPEYKKTIGVDYAEREIPVRVRNARALKRSAGLSQIDKEEEEAQLDASIDEMESTKTYDCETPTMMLWDCAGQSEFDTTTQQYYKGAVACILACSATDRQSFIDIQNWNAKVKKQCVQDLVTVLVLNKSELEGQGEAVEVRLDEAKALAKTLGVRFMPISVKNNTNIDSLFRYLARSHLEKVRFANSLQKSVMAGGKLPDAVASSGFLQAAQEIKQQPFVEAQPQQAMPAPSNAPPPPSKQKTGFFAKLKASMAN